MKGLAGAVGNTTLTDTIAFSFSCHSESSVGFFLGSHVLAPIRTEVWLRQPAGVGRCVLLPSLSLLPSLPPSLSVFVATWSYISQASPTM